MLITKYRISTVTREVDGDGKFVRETTGWREFKTLEEALELAGDNQVEEIQEKSVTDDAFKPKPPPMED